jgi:hypothetical protein
MLICKLSENKALLKKEWHTDAQPPAEFTKCGLEKANEGTGLRKKTVKCFDLKQDTKGGVILEYKGKIFEKDEFCILVDPEANDQLDHLAEICEKETASFWK